MSTDRKHLMNLLLITGGAHPYEETTPVLQVFLEEAGHSITLSESADELAGDLGQLNDRGLRRGGRACQESRHEDNGADSVKGEN